MDVNAWLETAQRAINRLPAEQIFVVKDLYEGVEWNALLTGDKLAFGRAFKNAVNEQTILNVEYVGKAQNNSALYRKI